MINGILKESQNYELRVAATAETVKNLIKLSPEKVIYVSCNPATMARDIEMLVSEIYIIQELQPLDMFPHTPHIECVTTLILN